MQVIQIDNLDTPHSISEHLKREGYRKKLKAMSGSRPEDLPRGKMDICFLLNRKDIHSKQLREASLKTILMEARKRSQSVKSDDDSSMEDA